MTLIEIMRFPPATYRLLAHCGRRGLTHRDIMATSGMSLATVSHLSMKRDWLGVSVMTASRFIEACGIDPAHTKRYRAILRRGKLSWVDAARGQQRRLYRRIMEAA